MKEGIKAIDRGQLTEDSVNKVKSEEVRVNSLRQGYKNTELGWIPEGWQIENLDSISSLIDGDRSSNYPSPNEIVDDGIIFLSTSNIKNNKLVYNECKYITQEKFDSLKKGKLKDGDLIITLRGSIGNVAKFNVCEYDTGFINAQMLIIRSEKIDSSFLWSYLTSQKCQSAISTISSGSAQPQLTKKDLSSLKIVVPPLKEQQKIAEILSTVDSEIDDTDKLIEKTKELKKGLMQRLLTKGIGHKKFKKTEIGEIPVEWDVKILNNISDVRDGTHDSPKYVEQGIPFITSKNLKEYGIDFSDTNYISNEDHEKFSQRSNVDNGDILFGMIGTIGNPVIVRKEFEFSIKNVALIKFNDNSISNTFLLNILKSNLIEKQFEKLSNGGVQKFIALGMIRNLLIPIPSLEEQQQIANILSSVDTQIEIYENKKIKLEELKKGLMQQLLTGKIRVV